MKKKVVIVLETGAQPGRAQLIGILRDINAERIDWELDIVPPRRRIIPLHRPAKGLTTFMSR